MKEDEVYLKALTILNDALDGKTVNPVAVSTATNMFLMLWTSIHQERLKKEQIKDALREFWEETIEEKRKMDDHTVTILEKDGMFAAMAIDKGDSMKAYVGRYDARCDPSCFYQSADAFDDAAELLAINIKISASRGWRVAYQGQRIYG